MNDPDLHPAALLFPPLPPDEFKALVADISSRGLLHPIVLHEGLVLDGRNRLLACRQAGVEPRFTQWCAEGSPVSWVVSTNLVRRHLSSSQRAVLAPDLLPLLEAEAKGRQRLSLGRGRKSRGDAAAIAAPRGKASQFAARLTVTNSAYVERAVNEGSTRPLGRSNWPSDACGWRDATTDRSCSTPFAGCTESSPRAGWAGVA